MFLVWNGAVWSTGICMYRFKQLCLLLPELKKSKYLFQHWSFLIYILPMHFSEHPCFHSIPSLFFLPDRSTFHFVVIAVSSLFWLTDEQRRSWLRWMVHLHDGLYYPVWRAFLRYGLNNLFGISTDWHDIMQRRVKLQLTFSMVLCIDSSSNVVVKSLI